MVKTIVFVIIIILIRLHHIPMVKTIVFVIIIIRLHHIPMVKTIVFVIIRLHHYMVKTIVFVIIIIILFSSQMKFSGQTRNLYRYGPQVDLRTLTHFQ